MNNNNNILNIRGTAILIESIRKTRNADITQRIIK
jgi:hypothetical protein